MKVLKKSKLLNIFLSILILCLGGFCYLKFIEHNASLWVYPIITLLALILSFLLFFTSKKILPNINNQKTKWIIISIIILFAFLYGLLSILKHNVYDSSAYDLGIFAQTIYKYSHFQIADNTVRGMKNILGDHFSPILVIFAPLYWIWQDPRMLLIAQAIIVAIPAWPLYLIIKEKLKNNISIILVILSYLLFIGIWKAIDFDFHEIIIFPLLFLYAFYFLLKKHYWQYFLMFFLALTIKENICVYFAFFSFYIFFFQNKKIGIVTLLISIGWYFLTAKYLIPHFAQGNFAYFSFDALGKTEGEALKNTVSNPLIIFKIATDHSTKVETLLALGTSFGYLPLFAPIFIVLALPMLAEQVLYSAETHWAIGFHYYVAIAPVLILGAVFAIKKFKYEIALSLFVLFSTFFVAAYQESPMLKLLHKSFYKKEQWMNDTDEIIKKIPKNAKVIAQHSLVPHLANRDLIAGFPNYREPRLDNPDYVIFSLNASDYPFTKEELAKIMQQFIDDKQFNLLEYRNGVYLFQRKSQK